MRHIQVVSLRLVRERSVPYASREIAKSVNVFNLFRELLEDLDREAFWAVYLNIKNQINSLSMISQGTLNCTMVHPREVFKAAVLANAAGVITVHNHPSGDPSPSPEDRAITENLKGAGEMLGIKLLDHIIIGHEKFYSFRDSGDL